MKVKDDDQFLASLGLGGAALGGAHGAYGTHRMMGAEQDAEDILREMAGRTHHEMLTRDPIRERTIDVAFTPTPERAIPAKAREIGALEKFLAKAGIGAKGRRYLKGGIKGAALGGLAGLGIGELASLYSDK